VAIHFTWKPDWPTVSKLLPVIERELAPFDACPHWGKLFTTSPAELKRIHTKTPQFVVLCQRFDPQGKFRNEFLNRNVFG
jgi:xylitol oxidase